MVVPWGAFSTTSLPPPPVGSASGRVRRRTSANDTGSMDAAGMRSKAGKSRSMRSEILAASPPPTARAHAAQSGLTPTNGTPSPRARLVALANWAHGVTDPTVVDAERVQWFFQREFGVDELPRHLAWQKADASRRRHGVHPSDDIPPGNEDG